MNLSPNLNRNKNLGHHQRSSQIVSVLTINVLLVFQLEKKTKWKLMKTWLLLTTVHQVRKKGRGLIRFFYDYNDMILQLEPRYLNDHGQTE